MKILCFMFLSDVYVSIFGAWLCWDPCLFAFGRFKTEDRKPEFSANNQLDSVGQKKKKKQLDSGGFSYFLFRAKAENVFGRTFSWDGFGAERFWEGGGAEASVAI